VSQDRISPLAVHAWITPAWLPHSSTDTTAWGPRLSEHLLRRLSFVLNIFDREFW